MTGDPNLACSAAYEELLAAYDEALDAGVPLPPVPGGPTPLALDLDCLHRLHSWKVGRTPAAVAREVGRFRIRRELGRGGFGVVYLAFDPRLGRDVALKVPRPEVLTSRELRERFHREARAAAGLDHPNIVPVFEAGDAGPACYIAAAYCPGPTLREWLRGQADPVPFTVAAALVAALADGVAHAHVRGIVHRDLKPANVLLQPPAAGPCEDTPLPARLAPADAAGFTPRVTDFGLAKLADPDDAVTRPGAVLGTPSYMAPEQAEGRQEVGPATDVYALGAILYELLTGRPPFVGESDLDTLRQAGSHEPVPPSRLRLRMPGDLETVCLKCLEKEPRLRYPAVELAADLRRFLTGEPVAARRVGLAGRLWRHARRRPLMATLLGAVVALTVGGTAAVTVLWRATAAALVSEQTARQGEIKQREQTEAQLTAKLTALARIEWEAGHLDRAVGHLRECAEPYRDGEWQYLARMCRAAVVSFPHRTEHTSRIACSPDGRYLATVSSHRQLKVWDLTTRTELFTSNIPPTANPDLLHKVRVELGFTPDSLRLVVASQVPPAAIPASKPGAAPFDQCWQSTAWDPATGRRLDHTMFGWKTARPVVYSSAGPFRADGDGKLLRVTNLLSGEMVEFAHGHRRVRYLQFSGGSRYLLSIAQGEPLKVWETSTGRLVSTIPARVLSRYDETREQLSPDGRRFLQLVPSDDVDGVLIKVWDVGQDRELSALRVSRLQLGHIRFSPDGQYLATIDWKAIRVWDVAAGREVLVLRGHTGRVLDIAFTPDGQGLVSVGLDNIVRVWDLTTAEG